MVDSSHGDWLDRLFRLTGRTALITGASSGIGEHAARLFAGTGAKVVLAARTRTRVEALASEIVDAGGEALAVEMDVTDRDSVEFGVETAVRRFGGLDILLNNAGIARTDRYLDMSEEDWLAVLETNLSGVWRVGQLVARQMVSQESGGSIINVASILGLATQRRQANYAAAKAGVIQLTRTMALELGRRGVRVNAIAPGYVVTGINREFFDSERGREYVQGLFPGRPGELGELDGVLLLLAGAAGSYIQGVTIPVDGGALLGSL